jgi:hypothetical protein
MVNMTEPRIAEKYGYETNSMAVSAGHFLLKLVGICILYMVGVGIWWLS